MRVLLAVLVLSAAGCVHPVRLMASKKDEGVVAFSVFLNLQAAPNAYQLTEMENMATEECRSEQWRVVEEGTDVSSTPYFSMIGNVASAGQTQQASYYWIVKCRGADPAQAADPASDLRWRFVVCLEGKCRARAAFPSQSECDSYRAIQTPTEGEEYACAPADVR